jgi:hypothetical protein
MQYLIGGTNKRYNTPAVPFIDLVNELPSAQFKAALNEQHQQTLHVKKLSP